MNLTKIIKPAAITASLYGQFMNDTYGFPVHGSAENDGVNVYIWWDLDIAVPPTTPAIEAAWTPWELEYLRSASYRDLDDQELALYADGYPETVMAVDYLFPTTVIALLLMRAAVERANTPATIIELLAENITTGARYDIVPMARTDVEVLYTDMEDFILAATLVIDASRKQAADATNVGQLP